MKDFLIKCYAILNNFFDKVMKIDGMKHFIMGALIATILGFILPTIFVLVVTSVILLLKEWLFDEKMNQGINDPVDFIWGALGMFIGVF